MSALHDDLAPLFAYAAQALSLATIISTPKVFTGAVAGIKTNGVIPLTLAEGGKLIIRESATVEFCVLDEMSQGTDAIVSVVVEGIAIEDEVHLPAVDAVVPFTLRQRQAEQPTVINADAEQQQPPRQAPDAQSKGEEHASPGLTVRHAPV